MIVSSAGHHNVAGPNEASPGICYYFTIFFATNADNIPAKGVETTVLITVFESFFLLLEKVNLTSAVKRAVTSPRMKL